MEGLAQLLEGQRLPEMMVNVLLDLVGQGGRLRVGAHPQGGGAGDGQRPVQQGQHQAVAEHLAVLPLRGEVAEHDVVQGPEVRQLRTHGVDRGLVLGDEGVFPQARQPQAAHGDAPAAEGTVGELVVYHAAVEYQQVPRPDLVGVVADQEAGMPLVDEQYLHKVRVGVEQPWMGLLSGRPAADVQQPGHGLRREGGLIIPFDKTLDLRVLHKRSSLGRPDGTARCYKNPAGHTTAGAQRLAAAENLENQAVSTKNGRKFRETDNVRKLENPARYSMSLKKRRGII